jgi:hypothetical protein
MVRLHLLGTGTIFIVRSCILTAEYLVSRGLNYTHLNMAKCLMMTMDCGCKNCLFCDAKGPHGQTALETDKTQSSLLETLSRFNNLILSSCHVLRSMSNVKSDALKRLTCSSTF